MHLALPSETVTELDRWLEELRGSVPGGGGISRADLIRDILQKAVQARIAARKPKAKGRP